MFGFLKKGKSCSPTDLSRRQKQLQAPNYSTVLAQLMIITRARTWAPSLHSHCSRARPIASADTTKFIIPAGSIPPMAAAASLPFCREEPGHLQMSFQAHWKRPVLAAGSSAGAHRPLHLGYFWDHIHHQVLHDQESLATLFLVPRSHSLHPCVTRCTPHHSCYFSHVSPYMVSCLGTGAKWQSFLPLAPRTGTD